MRTDKIFYKGVSSAFFYLLSDWILISDAVQPGPAVDDLTMQTGIGARILLLVGFRNHFAAAGGAFAREGFALIAPAKK